MELSYKGIVIRNAEDRDAARLAGWWNDGKVMAHAGFPNGLGTNEDKVKSSLARGADDTGRVLIIEYETQPIGEMSYSSQDGNTAEMGIKICEPVYQEKGIGRIALSMLIKELFRMGHSKIILDTNLKNTRAQHVYEKLGFQKVRTRIDAWADQLGQLQSVIDYELTQDRFVDYSQMGK